MLGWHLKSSVLPCFPKAAMCGGKVQPPGSNVFCLHISGLGIEVTGLKALQVGLCDLSEQSTDPGSAGDAVPLLALHGVDGSSGKLQMLGPPCTSISDPQGGESPCIKQQLDGLEAGFQGLPLPTWEVSPVSSL